MLSREAILKAGARQLLAENEKEREMLLKILNEKPSIASSNSIRKLVQRNIKKLHWTQTAKGRERMRQITLARHKKTA